jgi:predicted MFS family arabinose efflux permease
MKPRHPYYVLSVLLLVFVLHHVDRNILLVLLEPIGREFGLSDTQLGALSGVAYALPFALAGIPLGTLADRVTRTRLLCLFVLVWSACTALAGFSRGFLMLLATRAAVGTAEAGAPPTMLSLLSDTFPANSRPAALSVLFSGPLIGLLLGSLLGGAAAAAFGWRGALWIVATPGILLACLLILTVPEPPRGAFEVTPKGTGSAATLRSVLRFAFGHTGVRAAVLGIVLASVVSIGISSWIPAFLMRMHGLPVQKAGVATALSIGLAGGLGTLTTAWIAARYARGRPERLLRLCGVAIAVSVPMGVIGAASVSTYWCVACLALWSFAGMMFIGPGHSLYLGWAPSRMRGTLAAIVIVTSNLVGAGVGPQLVGAVSDLLRRSGDMQALPHALACLAVFGLVPSVLFLRASSRASGAAQRWSTGTTG